MAQHKLDEHTAVERMLAFCPYQWIDFKTQVGENAALLNLRQGLNWGAREFGKSGSNALETFDHFEYSEFLPDADQ